MVEKDYLKYCKLYKGEKSLQDNPISKENDDFKWYMWRHEMNAVRLAKDAILDSSSDKYREVYWREISAAIDNWAGTWNGASALPWIDKYCKM